MDFESVNPSLSEHLLCLLSVIAISHFIPGKGQALGHSHPRDKIQPCFSSPWDLGLGS